LLRKIFEPKRNGLRGEWSILHEEEFHDLYFSPNVILGGKKVKDIYMGWTYGTYGRERR
jgi:hypothetical protein